MPRKPDPCCRTCQLWDIDAARDKAGRVQKKAWVLCTWKSSEMWPDSIHPATHRAAPGRISGYHGEACLCWEERVTP